MGGQTTSESLWTIHMIVTTEVPDAAEIIVDGVTYDVVVTIGPHTNEVLRRVQVRRRGDV